MLKVAKSEEERLGFEVMRWWSGLGTAEVYEHAESAILMERACGSKSLTTMAMTDHDDEASRIICSVVFRLHSHNSNNPPSNLLTLPTWFRGLERAAKIRSEFFAKTYSIAESLLRSQQDIVVLHGDIHHANILDFGQKGWLAIDPKHIIGERSYDYVNLFLNPNAEFALKPGRLMKQLHLISNEADLDINRLLKWIISYAGLSAAWSIEDNENPHLAQEIGKIGLELLGNPS